MALPQIQIGDGIMGTALLASVEVTQELNRHWRCTVVCRDTEDRRIATEDLLGQPVVIKTLDERGIEHLHFSGFILDVALAYEVWGSYTATLHAVSESYRLDVTAHKQYYAEGTLASLAGLVAERSGLTVAIHTPGSKALNYVQYGETDFSFLNRLVDDHGAWLRPSEGGLEVFNTFQQGSSLALRQEGDGLLSFALKATVGPPGFSGSHYDFHAMQSDVFHNRRRTPAFFDAAKPLVSAVQAASQQLLPAGFEPGRARAMTLENYGEQLASESERAMGSAVLGRGTSRSQQLQAGNTVAITGVLDAAGTYGLVKVTHHWTPEGYLNEFTCTPWKNYRNPKPPAMREWEGMVPARVVAHNDPKQMGRLRVQFFWQEDGPAHWARMISPHAGPDRGFMMMPEVGDEVGVMFEDGDPERPVIVGSLWNGVQQAPRQGFFAPEADIPDNNVKRLLTKSGNRLQMVDTPGVETMLLATPHHTKLRMTEKDGTTARTLVHVHSEGDIVLSAPKGRVHMQSQFFSREVSASTQQNDQHHASGSGKKQSGSSNLERFPSEIIRAAQAANSKWKIPASVTLAQWALESGYGRHMPALSNNPFGIKAVGNQPFIEVSTREVVQGQSKTVTARFRKFPNLSDAFDEHGRLLAENKHYENARNALPDVDGFADRLTGTYATDPQYGSLLKDMINTNDLRQFDAH